MNIALQSTSKVTLKSHIFPSPYAMFKCSSSVEEGIGNSTESSLQSPFCLLFKKLVGMKIGFQTSPINNKGLVLS